MEFTPKSFDDWASQYDAEVKNESMFPFSGYSQVLRTIVQQFEPTANMKVLDLGCGTGNLSALFYEAGCEVCGIDFSTSMLGIARRKYPAIEFIQGDIREEIPSGISPKYDAIVSAYTFHHFPIEQKIKIIKRLIEKHLNPIGHLVIGDLAFDNSKVRSETAEAFSGQWDEEDYWMLDSDVPLLTCAGLVPKITRVSYCAAVIQFC